MSKQCPPYTIGDDGTVQFADGFSYKRRLATPGETRATPEEMYAILFRGPAATPAEVAEDQIRRSTKANLGTYDLRGN